MGIGLSFENVLLVALLAVRILVDLSDLSKLILEKSLSKAAGYRLISRDLVNNLKAF